MAKKEKKQAQIPGTERETIDEIEEIADPQDMDIRTMTEAQGRVRRRAAQMEAALHRHGITSYVFEDGDRKRKFWLEPGHEKLKSKEMDPDE